MLDQVKNVLNNAKTWIMATVNATPNAVPIFFKKVAEDGSLVLFDVFMNKSTENIAKNPKVSIVAYDEGTMEGYQLKGTAVYSADPKVIAEGNAMTESFKLTTKGAVLVKVEETIVLTPGGDNGKTL